MSCTEVLLFIFAIFSLAYYWCKRNYSYWQINGIPYIRPIPFLGNMKKLMTLKTGLGLFLSDIYNVKSAANEAVMGIYIFHRPALILREPELIKSVLIKDFNKFHNRSSACDQHNDPLSSYNMFIVKNPYWREVRTKISPVFTSGKIKQMYPLMVGIGQELEKYLDLHTKADDAFVCETKELCALFTTDVIGSVAFGIQANSLQNPNAEIRQQGRKVLQFTLSRAVDFFVIFFLPKLVRLFRAKLFTKEFTIFIRKTINHVIAERERSGTIRNDLIDILVTLKKEASLSDVAKNNDFLVAQAAVFLAAGFETSSATMSHTLYELAKHQELQKRLRSEICEAFLAGNGSISYEKIFTLEYLDMVFQEVLRLYPVLTFLDREYDAKSQTTETDFTLKPYYDYKLADGMPVFIPIFAIQRDPKYWPNAETFDPERFASANIKLHHPMTYLPFGNGPRNCIGSRMGILQVKLGLVHLLKNFQVMPCEKTPAQLSFDPKSFVLQSKDGVYLKIVKDNLYENATIK